MIRIVIAAALALAATLPLAPAQAQENRTFVSSAGSDTNSCTSATLPCRHFKAAYAATPAGGEIDVLDPANYGSLTITGPLSIQGNGWAASSAVSGEPVFTINASTNDEINIRGVVLDGVGAAGSVGIQFNSGGSLNVQNSVIRNFGSVGIAFVPNGSSALFVSNTIISDLANANGTGINIAPSGGTVTAVINRTDVQRGENGDLCRRREYNRDRERFHDRRQHRRREHCVGGDGGFLRQHAITGNQRTLSAAPSPSRAPGGGRSGRSAGRARAARRSGCAGPGRCDWSDGRDGATGATGAIGVRGRRALFYLLPTFML